MLGQTGMAARTDCVVLGDDSALLMVTVRPPFAASNPVIPSQSPRQLPDPEGGC
eukprot:COSAG04_NODE_3762_length_2553_cov_1.007746_4_plen_54_part_00